MPLRFGELGTQEGPLANALCGLCHRLRMNGTTWWIFPRMGSVGGPGGKSAGLLPMRFSFLIAPKSIATHRM